MKKQLFFSFMVLMIAFCGCKKEDALDVYPEMLGKWVSDAYAPDGSLAEFAEGKNSKFNCYAGSEIHAKGKATLKGDMLKIGREEFVLKQPPHYDENGDYSMQINNEVVIKSIAPRVRRIDEYTTHAEFFLWFASLSDQGFTHGYFSERLQSLDLQYKLQADPTWTTIINWNTYQIANLTSGSTYEYRIKAHYAWGDSEYSQVRTFTTQ